MTGEQTWEEQAPRYGESGGQREEPALPCGGTPEARLLDRSVPQSLAHLTVSCHLPGTGQAPGGRPALQVASLGCVVLCCGGYGNEHPSSPRVRELFSQRPGGAGGGRVPAGVGSGQEASGASRGWWTYPTTPHCSPKWGEFSTGGHQVE